MKFAKSHFFASPQQIFAYVPDGNYVRGNWTVQRTDGHGFSFVACDQTFEHIVNRDAKTKG